jgi:hypothetical protein
MSYYDQGSQGSQGGQSAQSAWSNQGRQPSWEQPAPPARSGKKSVVSTTIHFLTSLWQQEQTRRFNVKIPPTLLPVNLKVCTFSTFLLG